MGVDYVWILFLEVWVFGDCVKGVMVEGVYLGMRNAILERWVIDGACGMVFEEKDVVWVFGVCEVDDVVYVVDLFWWLEENGGINYGIFKEAAKRESDVETKADADAKDGDVLIEVWVMKVLIVVFRLVDLMVDIEKVICYKFEVCMGVGLKEFKLVIRETIEKFLVNLSEFVDVEDDVDDVGEMIMMVEILL